MTVLIRLHMKNMNDRFTTVWKEIVPLPSPYFSILNFNTLLLWLEVGMTFKLLIMTMIYKYCVMEMHQGWRLGLLYVIIEWKSFHYSASDFLSTIQQNLAYRSIMVMWRTRLKTLRFHKENLAFLTIQTR